jgi:hypothetical protein
LKKNEDERYSASDLLKFDFVNIEIINQIKNLNLNNNELMPRVCIHLILNN